MKSYEKEPTQKFEFVNTSKDVWTINGTVKVSDGQVLVTGPSGNRVYDKDDFRSEYDYVFKEDVTGECRFKRVIDDVEIVSEPRYIPI